MTTNLANEVTRATDAENAIASDLAAEVSRATAAEGNVETFNSYSYTGYAGGSINLTQAITKVDTALGNEVTRATAAEGELTTNLAAEVSRAQTAEEVLQSNIDTEESERKDADIVLQQNIDALGDTVTTNLGKITRNYGNLNDADDFGVRNTVADNLMSLDAAIGDRSAITNGMGVLYSEAGIQGKTLSTAISQIASNIGDADDLGLTVEGGIKNSYSVNKNIAALNTLIQDWGDKSEEVIDLVGQYDPVKEHANIEKRFSVIENLENLGDKVGELETTTSNGGYLGGISVAQDLKNLDNEVKRIGDFAKDPSGNYTDSEKVINITKSDTVTQNLMALDQTIGELADGRHLDKDDSVAENLTSLDDAVSAMEDHVGTSWNGEHTNIDTNATLTANVEALGDMIGKMSDETQGNIYGGSFDANNTVAANLEKLDQAIGNLSGTGVLEAGETDISVAHQLSTLNDKIGATNEVIGDMSDLNQENGHFDDNTKTVVDALNALDGTIGSLGNTMIDGVSNDSNLKYVADADYDSAAAKTTARSVSDNLAALDQNLSRVDTAVGDWTGSVSVNKDAESNYGMVDVATITAAISTISNNIGSAQVFTDGENDYQYNDVSADKSVNANIVAINKTLGNMSKLGTMTDSDGNAYKNLSNGTDTVPTTVVEALNNIDATLGTIHGLADKLGDNYNGNLSTEGTVEHHLTAIDLAIGDRNSMSFDGYAEGGKFADRTINYTMPTGDDKLNVSDSISYVASHIGTADQLKVENGTDEEGNTKYDYINGVSGTNTVNQNIAALNTTVGDVARLREAMYATNRDAMGEAIDTSVTDAITNLDTHLGNLYDYTQNTVIPAVNTLHNRYRKLRKEFQAGMASMAAMSALAPNARAVGDTQLSIGTGEYSGHTAAAVGAYHWLTDNLMLNIGAAWGGDSAENIYRMGVTYSW